MMKDRGYTLSESFEDMTDLAVGAKYLNKAKSEKITLSLALSSVYTLNGKKLLVLFLDNNYDEGKKKEKMVSSEQAKAAIEKWKTSYSDCEECLLIAPGRFSPDAKKESSVANLTILIHEFLMLPIGRHIMVPKHTSLTQEETNEFLKSRKIDRCQLPQLKLNDPVCMYYGYKPDTIVRVERPGWTVYRVVIP
jgi:DNA-directed RNA polymerase subunit H (RpoH/RPB5)